jgi:hypothetical protein
MTCTIRSWILTVAMIADLTGILKRDVSNSPRKHQHGQGPRTPACSVNVHICPNRSRGGEGFRRGGVVAAAFGDVQVVGVLEGRDEGGADGGQVGGPAAGAAGRGIFAEAHVRDVTSRSPVQGSRAAPEHLCLTRPYVPKARTFGSQAAYPSEYRTMPRRP